MGKEFERLTGGSFYYTPFEFSDMNTKINVDFNTHVFPFSVTKKNNAVINIKEYIINENATIIFWEDGTKTVVKKTKEDKFDKRLGLLIGYFQKNCGMSKTKANKFLDNLVVTEKAKKEK